MTVWPIVIEMICMYGKLNKKKQFGSSLIIIEPASAVIFTFPGFHNYYVTNCDEHV